LKSKLYLPLQSVPVPALPPETWPGVRLTGEATHSQVVALAADARVEEIARMLGGVEITREVRANAKQMLTRAQQG